MFSEKTFMYILYLLEFNFLNSTIITCSFELIMSLMLSLASKECKEKIQKKIVLNITFITKK